MRKLKWVPMFLLLALSLALLGGCGGGGGGDSGSTPAPAPAPSPSPEPAPQPSDEIDINALAGSWEAVEGSGSATGPDGNFDLRMIFVTSTFSNVSGSGSSATAFVTTASARWESYQNGVYQRTVPLEYRNESVQIQRIAKNTWQYVFPSTKSKLTFTFESATRAKVVEEGNFGLGIYNYQYKGNYTMAKQ